MRVKGEIVFPNNLKELRRRRQLTQAQLGRLMDPPVGESTISKMESGERRLTSVRRFARLEPESVNHLQGAHARLIHQQRGCHR